MAVVFASMGHMGGKWCSGGRFWPPSTVPRSGVATLALIAMVTRTTPLGTSECSSKSFALGGDARGCRSLREDVVVVLGLVSGLRVKTHVCLLGLGSGFSSRHHPLKGVVVEPRLRRSVFGEVLG